MQPTVKLSSRHFQSLSNSDTAVYTHDPEWISNGHWLIQRVCVTNQDVCTPDLFPSTFQRPSTPVHPTTDRLPDFWDFIGFDTVDRKFRVTRWTYVQDLGVRPSSTGVKAGGTIQLRLLLTECDTETEGETCHSTTHYFCFLDENYVDALGLETGDVLEARHETSEWSKGSVLVLRSADLSRCVGTRKLTETDARDLGSVVEVETELHGVTRTTTDDGGDGEPTSTSQVVRRPRYKVDTLALADLFTEG